MANLRCTSKSPFALKTNRKRYTFKELYLTERITDDNRKVFAVFLRGGELACLPRSVELLTSSPSHNNNNNNNNNNKKREEETRHEPSQSGKATNTSSAPG